MEVTENERPQVRLKAFKDLLNNCIGMHFTTVKMGYTAIHAEVSHIFHDPRGLNFEWQTT